VGELQFVGARNEFAAIPETAGGFAGEEINSTSNDTHYPAGNVVDFSKIHNEVNLMLSVPDY
jgi:hypothetical protein